MLWLIFAIVAMLASGAGLAFALDRYGASRSPRPAALIVVAGSPARADGTASRALARRMDRAISLWREGLAPRIAISGGPNAHGHTEAAAGIAYARERGVPEHALHGEHCAQSTDDNAKLLAEQIGPTSVLVVTDIYHVWRCERVFSRYFTDVAVVGVYPRGRSRIRLALRELVVITVYAAQGRLRR